MCVSIDIIQYVPQSDVVILASGDVDFDLLIEKIRNKYDILAEIYGISHLTANSLINYASKFFPIKENLLLK